MFRDRQRLSRVLAALLLAATTALPHRADAQTRTLSGVVRDSAGAPIPEADVSIPAAHLLTRTDTGGAFSISRVSDGHAELLVRRLGFVPATLGIDMRPGSDARVTVVLAANPLELPGVMSQENLRHLLWIEDFYRRRSKGIGGTYFTRDDIEARHANRLSDVLRDAPGVRFIRTRDGSALRFDAASNFRRDCVPQIWVDGQRVPSADVDDFPARDIEGVELYAGPSSTPMQFSQGAVTTCGTVVLWSRVPGG